MNGIRIIDQDESRWRDVLSRINRHRARPWADEPPVTDLLGVLEEIVDRLGSLEAAQERAE